MSCWGTYFPELLNGSRKSCSLSVAMFRLGTNTSRPRKTKVFSKHVPFWQSLLQLQSSNCRNSWRPMPAWFTLDAKTNLVIMLFADALQWISLDRTFVALLAASITAVGGPLSELPFVANGFWHYNVDAADYFPLSGTLFESGGIADAIASSLLGEEYNTLALSSITGPCYFAVTLDAIALGRYFDQRSDD